MFLLHDADEAIGTGVIEDTLSELNKEDELPESEPEKETVELSGKEDEVTVENEDEEEPKKKDELSEIEEELNLTEDTEIRTPPKRREILAKYPTLFKDFPYLQSAYYREQQFTEVNPTIEDAREAKSKADTLDKFEADLASGNIETTLKIVKSYGDDVFNETVDNYLVALSKVDKDSYTHVVGNIVRNTVIHMVQAARDNGDTELEEAARILNKFVFQSNKIQAPVRLGKDKTAEKDDPRAEIELERQKLVQEKFDNARDTLQTRVDNTIKNTIMENIDPKGSMTEYVKKNAVRDCFEEVTRYLDSDKRLVVIMDKLWEVSHKDNFSQRTLEDLRKAYLSRFKSVALPLIKKSRNEAFKGMGKRIREDEDDTPKKGPVAPGKTAASRSNSSLNPREESKKIPHHVSTLDYLNSD
jgi:hypothetical protein